MISPTSPNKYPPFSPNKSFNFLFLDTLFSHVSWNSLQDDLLHDFSKDQSKYDLPIFPCIILLAFLDSIEFPLSLGISPKFHDF